MAPRGTNVDDWHDRLITAAQARYAEAVRNNRRTLNAWKKAVSDLQKSRSKIYVLKSGPNKGTVTGIPNSIPNVATQILIKIVMEEEPVLRPEHEGRLDADITDEPVVRNRQYRDSAYAILAALYVEYQGPGQNPQPTQVLKNRAKRYTDLDIEGNFMAGTHGAWEANKQLKQKGLITMEKQGGNYHYFTLTLAGAKACRHLFTQMYHPSRGDYDLVQPRRGWVDAGGNWHADGTGGGRAMDAGGGNDDFDEDVGMGGFGADDDQGFGGGYGGFGGFGGFGGGFGRDAGVVSRKAGQDGGIKRDRGFLGDLDEDDVDELHPPKRPHPSTPHSIPTAAAATEMRRRRMLKLDPSIAEKVVALMHDAGVGEEEAWGLYEQGACDAPAPTPAPTRTVASSSTNKLTNKPVQTPQPTVLDDDDEELERAIQLSVQQQSQKKRAAERERAVEKEEVVVELEDSQDQLDLAIAMSLAEEEGKKQRKTAAANMAPHHPTPVPAPTPAPTPKPAAATPKSTVIAIDLTDDEGEGKQRSNSRNRDKTGARGKPGKQDLMPIVLEDSFEESRDFGHVSGVGLRIEREERGDDVIELLDEADDFSSSSSEEEEEEDAAAMPVEHVLGHPTASSSSKQSAVAISHPYARDAVPSCSLLHGYSATLYVDRRERKQNNTYREFYKQFVHLIDRYIPQDFDVGCEEKPLHIGDFTLSYTRKTSAAVQHACNVPEGEYSAELLIERKAIRDIITRSAEGVEAPHFVQEKSIRNAGMKYGFMLIEGDISNPQQFQPSTYSDSDRDKIDVIKTKEELLGYMLGVLCRNVGAKQVLVIHTTAPSETAIFITAIVGMIRWVDSVDSSNRNRVERDLKSFASVNKYWCGKTRNKRQQAFAQLLQEGSVSADTQKRVVRRFGEIDTLKAVYSGISREYIGKRLLCDLSLAGSNWDPDVVKKDTDAIGSVSMCAESGRIYSLVHLRQATHSSPADLSTPPAKVVRVTASSALADVLEGFKSFAVSVAPSIIQDNRMWCTVQVVDHCTPRLFRRSGRLYIAVLSGSEVLVSLLSAYVLLTRSSGNSGGSSTRDLDMQIVEQAWEHIISTLLPVSFVQQYHKDKSSTEYPQVLILLEGLGRGGGVIGACGRLKKGNAACLHSNSSSSGDSYILSLADGESITVSKQASIYLCSRLEYLIALFSAHAYIVLQWQCMHAQSSEATSMSVKQVVACSVLEMQRLALLTYDKPAV